MLNQTPPINYISCIFLIIFAMGSTTATAQDDYKYEIGGALGANFYMGTANRIKMFDQLGPTVGTLFRYKMDLRWALKTNLFYGKIKGNTSSSPNVFPFQQTQSFQRDFLDAGAQVEMNLFNYSDHFKYLGTTNFTPYVLLGFGLTYGSGEKKFFDVNIPMGVGLKYKIRPRLNLGFEVSFRKLFSDSFDVTNKDGFQLDDPYHTGGDTFKNNDWYVLSLFSLTWDFGARPCPCLNIK